MGNKKRNFDESQKKQIGIRLKQEAKKRSLSNTDMMDLLQYGDTLYGNTDGHYISEFYSGKRVLPDEKLAILAKEWGVRIPYLLCESDIATDEEFYEKSHQKDLSEYTTIIDYLSSLGLTFNPCIFWECSIQELIFRYPQVRDILTKEAQETAQDITIVSSIIKDSSNISSTIFLEIKDVDYLNDFDKKSQTKKPMDSVSAITPMISYWSDERIEEWIKSADFDENPMFSIADSFKITLLYKVFLNKRYIGLCSRKNLEVFFSLVDKSISTLFQSLFESKALLVNNEWDALLNLFISDSFSINGKPLKDYYNDNQAHIPHV